MSDEAPKSHKVFKTLTFDFKSSSFTSNNDSPTTPTINLPIIAGSKPLPRALQPKTNHQGVSAGYKPLFTGYGSVSKNSEDSQARRSSMICTTTFKSQCSLSRPSTTKGSAEHSTPLRHRNSVQVECPTSVRDVQSSKPGPSPTTIHVSKHSGVDNGSIFLALGDVFGKRDPVEEMRKSEEVVMRNLGRHCKGEGRPDPPSSTVSRAFISLQGSNKQKGNSSVDATNLDLSWSSSHGKQKVSKDGVILAGPSEHFPGTIRLFLNSEVELEKNSNGSKEIDPSPIQVLTTKRNQVTITPAGDHKSSHQSKASTLLEVFQDTPRAAVRSSGWKNMTTASSKTNVTNVTREVPADEGTTEEFKTSSHPGSTLDEFKESDRRDRISSNDDDDDNSGDDNDEADRDGAEHHAEGADDVTRRDEMNPGKYEPCHEKIVSKEDEARANEECDDDDDDRKNVVDGDDYKNVIDDVHKNEIDNADDEVGDVVGKCDETIRHVGIKDVDDDDDVGHDNDVDDDDDVGHDNDIVGNEVEVPVSFPESFDENGETTQAERSTCSIKGSMTSYGNQSTVKSNEIHELIGKKNFSEDSSLLTRVEHEFGSDDSGCEESTTPLFIDDSHDQKGEDAKNDDKESTSTTTTTTTSTSTTTTSSTTTSTTTKHDKQLRRNCELIDNSVECLPSKVEGIQRSIPRNSTLRTSGIESSKVRDEVVNFDTTTVKLEKGFLGVGFCIEGGRASPYGDKPILIKRVVRGDVPLRAGDELVSVNGKEVSSMTSAQVWSLLKSLPGGVMVLELRRKE